MSKRHDFEFMIAQRIELATSKTSTLVASAPQEPNPERRKTLEDCGQAIALAVARLGDLKAASGVMWDEAQRDMKDVWRCMETAVRGVTGEPPVTLVAALTVPSLAAQLAN